MAALNINRGVHQIHAFLQSARITGFTGAVAVGIILGGLILGASVYQVSKGSFGEKKTSQQRLAQIESTVAKLQEEKSRQAVLIAATTAANASKQVHESALNGGAVTEEDVRYWQKQLSAYSMLTSTQVYIVGRSMSQFKDATKVTVHIDADRKDGAASGGAKYLIQALDFLQLYGYVESFDGKEAVVHIANSNP